MCVACASICAATPSFFFFFFFLLLDDWFVVLWVPDGLYLCACAFCIGDMMFCVSLVPICLPHVVLSYRPMNPPLPASRPRSHPRLLSALARSISGLFSHLSASRSGLAVEGMIDRPPIDDGALPQSTPLFPPSLLPCRPTGEAASRRHKREA